MISNVPSIPFRNIPIGARFDIVPPTSHHMWGNPFFVKLSATEHCVEGHTATMTDIGPSGKCWLDEDALRRAVRLVREGKQADVLRI